MTITADTTMDVLVAEMTVAKNSANATLDNQQASDYILSQEIIERFVSVYKQLNKDNLGLLGDIYSEDICFIDPLHKIAGLTALTSYFETLYQNVESIDFVIHQVVRDDGAAALKWTMNLVHPKLNTGNIISVDGMSLLMFTDKINHHQDYFDLGAMLYEQLPIVGGLIGFIKSKVAK
ncbi:nuclear transport factor 2 family protein [Shewanella gelidimarina]|uniref:nuclear transport factor 2 family protein n=1 Tax=Shewanella gelidimarina TaxID=56813 RepID=UPI00200D1E8D|nr:nuclear transport factor 2 family protein [Shewanella gelidimarina]MCL1058617.1 nuclear transport factor 2 family protein [Shewanella gelidimarina]